MVAIRGLKAQGRSQKISAFKPGSMNWMNLSAIEEKGGSRSGFSNWF
jgi:hypothetical protein